MSQNAGDMGALDPFGPWRQMRDLYTEAMSKNLIDFVNSEQYARAMGAFMDSYLTASGPLRKALEQAMSQVLPQLNMPTRADVTSLAERLTNIEMRLDDLDAALSAARHDSTGSGETRQ